MTTTLRLAYLRQTVIILLFLLIALFAFGLLTHTSFHSAASTGHSIVDVDAPPPGH